MVHSVGEDGVGAHREGACGASEQPWLLYGHLQSAGD